VSDESDQAEIRQFRFEAPAGSTEVLLVRHGESAPARADAAFELVDGHGDPPLAPQGRWQAEQLGLRLAGEGIDAIYVTSLRRTQETAAPLARLLGIEPVIERDLREVFLGEWEGGVFRFKAAEGDPHFIAAMEQEDWGHIPGAESNQELAARVLPALGAIVERHRDQRVVVVAHGGVIGCILAHITSSRPFAFAGNDNGSISHVVAIGDRWVLRRFNDTGHLAGELSAVPEPPT
jgi:probable phosphoglycerate mutase